MMRSRRTPLTIALLALDIALGGLLYRQIDAFSRPEAIAALPAAPGGTDDLRPTGANSVTGPSADRPGAIAGILARPVFSQSRRPDRSSHPPASDGRDVTLVGVVLSGPRRIALIHVEGTSQLLRIAEGERGGRYRVDRVRADGVRIYVDDRPRDLPLRLHPPPATRQTNAPAAPRRAPVAAAEKDR